MVDLTHDFVIEHARHAPDAPALTHCGKVLTYEELACSLESFAGGLIELGLEASDRIGIYLAKSFETVIALFGTSTAGCVFVPINPLLKPRQVSHILRDCNVRVLVTSSERAALLTEVLEHCADLHSVVVIGDGAGSPEATSRIHHVAWDKLAASTRPRACTHRRIETDMAAILYTSGSTGHPKGVVLSHRNLVAGAKTVSMYLENRPEDRILALLPFSFDAGLSQLTTAFSAGANAILMDYLLARDVIKTIDRERITGLTAVPPVWVQLAGLTWPEEAAESLRYIANTGGRMPITVTAALRRALPKTKVYLMYGLTEAFRSTYLPPDEIDRRPDSIGKAIPNAEILVVREGGTECDPGEPGELVHRGPLVALGYWNDPEKTARRFRPAPGQPSGISTPELAVWSGDTVQRDEAGFLYFIGRRDEMIKTSGYRVSPTEVEEVLYASGMITEAAAVGVSHPTLGQGIIGVVTTADESFDIDALLAVCQRELPNFMVPLLIVVKDTLPRNPNGKLDRRVLAEELQDSFQEPNPE